MICATQLSLIVGLIFTICASTAQADVYNCTFAEQGNSGLIGSQIRVNIVDPANDVRIEDALTREFAGGWVRGKLEVSNAKRKTFVWEVEGLHTKVVGEYLSNRPTRYVYRLTVRPSGEATVSTRNVAFYNDRRDFRGDGQCTKGD
jgi:hypothetical protein